MSSHTEENYLKAIFRLTHEGEEFAGTTAISEALEVSSSAVSDMVSKLADKGYVKTKKYRGTNLTKKGEVIATKLIRRHRLWEFFLAEKLGFNWSKVHEIAEELEHIKSDELVNRLDDYLGNPEYDPHGDPIPTEGGKFNTKKRIKLSEVETGKSGVVVGVDDGNSDLLVMLDNLKINIGSKIKMLEKYEYDESCLIENKGEDIQLSSKVCKNIYIER